MHDVYTLGSAPHHIWPCVQVLSRYTEFFVLVHFMRPKLLEALNEGNFKPLALLASRPPLVVRGSVHMTLFGFRFLFTKPLQSHSQRVVRHDLDRQSIEQRMLYIYSINLYRSVGALHLQWRTSIYTLYQLRCKTVWKTKHITLRDWLVGCVW